MMISSVVRLIGDSADRSVSDEIFRIWISSFGYRCLIMLVNSVELDTDQSSFLLFALRGICGATELRL